MTNFNTRRQSLVKLLRNRTPIECILAPNPDHPLLIRGPDVLISTDRNITAIFIPLAVERNSPSLLKSRLTISRLALPAHTRWVLVVAEKDRPLGELTANDFAEVVDWSERETIIEVVSAQGAIGRHRDVPEEIIGDAQVRFENAMTVMRLSSRLAARPFSSAFKETDIAPDRPVKSAFRHPRRKPIIRRETSPLGLDGIASTELAGSEVDSSTVRTLINDQMEHMYSLDNGIPFQKSDTLGLAIVSDWPTSRRDSEKLILSAAFGGWAFVLEETRPAFPKFAMRMRQRFAR